jgi:hypothetical protein
MVKRMEKEELTGGTKCQWAKACVAQDWDWVTSVMTKRMKEERANRQHKNMSVIVGKFK